MHPLVKTLIFTIIVPGTVTVYGPYLLLPEDAKFSLEGSRLIGIVPLAVGIAVYLWCAWDFAMTGRGTPAPIDPPKVLVTRGLYRIVRNPMYIGVLFILIGEVIIFSSWILLIYVSLAFMMVNMFIFLYEEPTLRKQFGTTYEEYCKNVPRWMPKLKRNNAG